MRSNQLATKINITPAKSDIVQIPVSVLCSQTWYDTIFLDEDKKDIPYNMQLNIQLNNTDEML